MADQEEGKSIESGYANRLLGVLPLFICDLPCYNHVPRAENNIMEEDELKNLRGWILFEIRFLHVTLNRAKAALVDDAFVGCAEVLKSLLNLLETMLRDTTVNHLASCMGPPKKKRKKIWLDPQRILAIFRHPPAKNQDPHVKLRALHDFLQDAKGRSAEPGYLGKIDWLVEMHQNSEELKAFLRLITTNNELLVLMLSTRIPSLQIDPKSRNRTLRQMKSPEFRARDSGNLLYKILAAKWPNCMVPHHASLRLTPYWKARLEGPQEAVGFDMLLSTHSEPSVWQEAMFAVDKRGSEPSKAPEIEDMCDLIQGSQQATSKPCVLLRNDRLFQAKLLRREQSIDSQPTIKLKDLLDGGHLTAGAQSIQLSDKRILAVILAHCLLQFAESPWMSKEWNSENIFFLYQPEDDRLPDIHRLYISTQFGTAQPQHNEGTLSRDASTAGQHAFFRHPSIIALGILLLEIETGRTIQPEKEDCDPETGHPNINTAWTTAGKMLKSPEIRGSVYQDFRSVIEACLEPKKFLPEGKGFNDLNFREKVYKNIVEPLEYELVNGWPDLDIGSLGIQMSSMLDTQSLPASLNLGRVERRHKIPPLKSPKSQFSVDYEPKPGASRLEDSSISKISGAEAAINTPIDMPQYPWWKSFEKTSSFMHKHRSGLSNDQAPKRVKVAILDTGYDRKDSLFKEAQKSLPGDIEFRDFVGNSQKPIDLSGHGTRVAYFLLQITSNVDLWIARVYEHDKGIPESAGRVKEAINEATRLGVDIICMSFGFDGVVEEIEQAIMAANTKGILVFAAASNDRGLASGFPISFPASMHSGVFCINSHSSDHEHKWSGFNPRFLPGKDNFCVIGENLHGPDSVPKSSANGTNPEGRQFEGTSYSTPIAVGIAALILEYGRSCQELQSCRAVKKGEREPLKKFQIMRAIFKAMCPPNYMEQHPNPVLPWRLLEHGKEYQPWEKIRLIISDEGR